MGTQSSVPERPSDDERSRSASPLPREDHELNTYSSQLPGETQGGLPFSPTMPQLNGNEPPDNTELPRLAASQPEPPWTDIKKKKGKKDKKDKKRKSTDEGLEHAHDDHEHDRISAENGEDIPVQDGREVGEGSAKKSKSKSKSKSKKKDKRRLSQDDMTEISVDAADIAISSTSGAKKKSKKPRRRVEDERQTEDRFPALEVTQSSQPPPSQSEQTAIANGGIGGDGAADSQFGLASSPRSTKKKLKKAKKSAEPELVDDPIDDHEEIVDVPSSVPPASKRKREGREEGSSDRGSSPLALRKRRKIAAPLEPVEEVESAPPETPGGVEEVVVNSQRSYRHVFGSQGWKELVKKDNEGRLRSLADQIMTRMSPRSPSVVNGTGRQAESVVDAPKPRSDVNAASAAVEGAEEEPANLQDANLEREKSDADDQDVPGETQPDPEPMLVDSDPPVPQADGDGDDEDRLGSEKAHGHDNLPTIDEPEDQQGTSSDDETGREDITSDSGRRQTHPEPASPNTSVPDQHDASSEASSPEAKDDQLEKAASRSDAETASSPEPPSPARERSPSLPVNDTSDEHRSSDPKVSDDIYTYSDMDLDQEESHQTPAKQAEPAHPPSSAKTARSQMAPKRKVKKPLFARDEEETRELAEEAASAAPTSSFKPINPRKTPKPKQKTHEIAREEEESAQAFEELPGDEVAASAKKPRAEKADAESAPKQPRKKTVAKKTVPVDESEEEEEKGLRPATKKTSNSGQYKTGLFDATEKAQVARAVERFRENEGLSQAEVNQLIHENPQSSKDPALSRLWSTVTEACPTRQRQKLINWCRQQFHNYVARGTWTQEQDDELDGLIRLHGTKWSLIGGLINRHPTDARDRYRNYLICRGKVKKDFWAAEEEEQLCKAVRAAVEKIRTSLGTKTNKSAEELINWQQISEAMGLTRTRLQCMSKWKHLRTTEAIPDDIATVLPTGTSWRLERIRSELRGMPADDKYRLARFIHHSGIRNSRKIPWWDKELKDVFSKRYQPYTLMVAWARLKHAVPDWETRKTKGCAEYLCDMFEKGDDWDGEEVDLDLAVEDEEELDQILDAMTPGSLRQKSLKVEIGEDGTPKSSFTKEFQRRRPRARYSEVGTVRDDSAPPSTTKAKSKKDVQKTPRTKKDWATPATVAREDDDSDSPEIAESVHGEDVDARRMTHQTAIEPEDSPSNDEKDADDGNPGKDDGRDEDAMSVDLSLDAPTPPPQPEPPTPDPFSSVKKKSKLKKYTSKSQLNLGPGASPGEDGQENESGKKRLKKRELWRYRDASLTKRAIPTSDPEEDPDSTVITKTPRAQVPAALQRCSSQTSGTQFNLEEFKRKKLTPKKTVKTPAKASAKGKVEKSEQFVNPADDETDDDNPPQTQGGAAKEREKGRGKKKQDKGKKEKEQERDKGKKGKSQRQQSVSSSDMDDMEDIPARLPHNGDTSSDEE